MLFLRKNVFIFRKSNFYILTFSKYILSFIIEKFVMPNLDVFFGADNTYRTTRNTFNFDNLANAATEY